MCDDIIKFSDANGTDEVRTASSRAGLWNRVFANNWNTNCSSKHPGKDSRTPGRRVDDTGGNVEGQPAGTSQRLLSESATTVPRQPAPRNRGSNCSSSPTLTRMTSASRSQFVTPRVPAPTRSTSPSHSMDLASSGSVRLRGLHPPHPLRRAVVPDVLTSRRTTPVILAKSHHPSQVPNQ